MHEILTPRDIARRQETLTSAYRKYQQELKSYSYFKLNDRTLSEDLVQDAFTKTWRYVVRGGNVLLMRSFLFHVLNGLVVDEYRKRKTVSLNALLEKGFEPGSEDHTRLIDTLDGRTAQQLIDKLPEKYQKVLRMRYMQHLSLSEMSLLTGQTKNTMAVQVHRGLEKLKVLYESGYAR